MRTCLTGGGWGIDAIDKSTNGRRQSKQSSHNLFNQDPRRALNEAVAAISSLSPVEPDPEPPQQEQGEEQPSGPIIDHDQQHQRPHHHHQQRLRQLERRDSRTLGGFLLTRRGSAIRDGGEAEGAVARGYGLGGAARGEEEGEG